MADILVGAKIYIGGTNAFLDLNKCIFKSGQIYFEIWTNIKSPELRKMRFSATAVKVQAADILVGGKIYIGGSSACNRSVGRSSSTSSVPSIKIPRILELSLETERVSKLEMARLLAILCLASVALAQDR